MAIDGSEEVALLISPRGDRDRKLIQTALTRVGFTVMLSESGTESLQEVSRVAGDLGLVVADPATPGLNFDQLLKTLDELASPARVLCLCEEHEAPHPFSGHAERFGGHLSRPFRRAQLLASILDASERPLARSA